MCAINYMQSAMLMLMKLTNGTGSLSLPCSQHDDIHARRRYPFFLASWMCFITYARSDLECIPDAQTHGVGSKSQRKKELDIMERKYYEEE